MVPRFAGASLGLLAFAITIVAGLYVQNPATVILSRSIFALFVFFVVGFVVGAAAQMVLSDRHRQREAELQERYKNDPVDSDPQGLNSIANADSRLSGEEVTA